MNVRNGSWKRWVATAAASAIMMLLAGCGGARDQASKMTSFSAAENPKSKAELFSLPADQMAHIQVVTVEQGPLARTLRLTGAVEYDDFKTTPGDHAGGRAGQPRLGRAGGTRACRPSAALHCQSRLLSAARVLSQGARRLPARRQILRARTRPLCAPRHCRGRS